MALHLSVPFLALESRTHWRCLAEPIVDSARTAKCKSKNDRTHLVDVLVAEVMDGGDSRRTLDDEPRVATVNHVTEISTSACHPALTYYY